MRFLRHAIVTIIVLALVICMMAYLRVRNGGLSADAQPGAIERVIAMRLVRLSLPAGADRETNPFAADANAWRTAVDHYQDHCATCHGEDGRGNTDVGENMYPKVPDLADARIQGLSDGTLFYIIQNGVRWTGMPAWKREHSAEETWGLVSLIRKLPSLTPQEREAFRKSETGEAEKPEHHEHKHPDSYRNPR
jgi:mono/diheme cytochrome c family protein